MLSNSDGGPLVEDFGHRCGYQDSPVEGAGRMGKKKHSHGGLSVRGEYFALSLSKLATYPPPPGTGVVESLGAERFGAPSAPVHDEGKAFFSKGETGFGRGVGF